MAASPLDPHEIRARLEELGSEIRATLTAGRSAAGSGVVRATDADTIYAIDADVEPVIEAFCAHWGKTTPLVVIAEGLTDDSGREGARVFPEGISEDDPPLRLILDPIDGTRGLMYDKRPAWSLAAAAPNRGPATRLRDAIVAVMTELPTVKQGQADVLSVIRGQGMRARRLDLRDGTWNGVSLQPSRATTINHGFASVTNFFPATKVLASELVEFLVRNLLDEQDITRATVFDDQYISTAGQWHELIAGRDRFNADLRGVFYRMQGLPEGMCCHPYDCATLLIAEEAGVILTDELGRPLDAPLDTTTAVNWVGYANQTLRRRIEPLVQAFLANR